MEPLIKLIIGAISLTSGIAAGGALGLSCWMGLGVFLNETINLTESLAFGIGSVIGVPIGLLAAYHLTRWIFKWAYNKSL
jgi:hypothetical protein